MGNRAENANLVAFWYHLDDCVSNLEASQSLCQEEPQQGEDLSVSIRQ